MDDTAAELSSISTTLDDLTARMGVLAARLLSDPDEPAAQEIFEVERALAAARRRLASARRLMRQ